MDISNIFEWKHSLIDWFALLVLVGLGLMLFISGIYAFVGFFRLIFSSWKRRKYKMFNCSSCGRRISYEAKHCPYCGHHYGQSYPNVIAIPMMFTYACFGVGFGLYSFITVLELLFGS